MKCPATPRGSCFFFLFNLFVCLFLNGALDVQIKSSFAVAPQGKFSVLGLCVNTDDHLQNKSVVDASGVLILTHFTWRIVWMRPLKLAETENAQFYFRNPNLEFQIAFKSVIAC